MAKLSVASGYPIKDGTVPAITSVESHTTDHPKPASGGGGTKLWRR
jgi:hypothetical protein